VLHSDFGWGGRPDWDRGFRAGKYFIGIHARKPTIYRLSEPRSLRAAAAAAARCATGVRVIYLRYRAHSAALQRRCALTRIEGAAPFFAHACGAGWVGGCRTV
jgi:hypothetical protein